MEDTLACDSYIFYDRDHIRAGVDGRIIGTNVTRSFRSERYGIDNETKSVTIHFARGTYTIEDVVKEIVKIPKEQRRNIYLVGDERSCAGCTLYNLKVVDGNICIPTDDNIASVVDELVVGDEVLIYDGTGSYTRTIDDINGVNFTLDVPITSTKRIIDINGVNITFDVPITSTKRIIDINGVNITFDVPITPASTGERETIVSMTIIPNVHLPHSVKEFVSAVQAAINS